MDPNEIVGISSEDASSRATAAFESVFANGPKIELDHHIVYYARKLIVIALT